MRNQSALRWWPNNLTEEPGPMLPSSHRPYANAALAHRQRWRGRVGLMLVASLSVLAGMTDAIGFMASGDFV
jgi:hypothetical protein